MHEHLMFGLVTLIALGAGSQLLAYHAKVPSILVLLGCGFVAGPVLGIVTPNELLGEITFPLVSLGAAVVLFEGGLTARFQDLKAIQSPVSRLVSVGLLVTWILSTAAAHFFVGLSLGLSALLGAVLVVTGPTVVGPILRHSRPTGSVGHILKYEGIINDPIGAVLALIVFQVIQVEQVETAALLVFWGVIRATAISAALGFVGSLLYAHGRTKGWIPAPLENAVLLASVLGIYALSNHVQPEAGLLAVTVMGMALASRKDVDVEANVEFAEHLRTMLISVLFILLTARIQPSDFAGVPWGGAAFVVVLILLVRPASVFLSTWGTGLHVREKVFLSLMAPRGIVAAAVSSVFALRLANDGFPGASLLLPLTFLVIASCVVVYGLAAKPLVKLLSLDGNQAAHVLLLGNNTLSQRIAEGLKQAGRDAVIVGDDRRAVLQARRRGFTAEFGHIQSNSLLNRLELEQFGFMIALSSSDDANTLGCVHFGRHLGKGAVAQVQVEHHEAAPGLPDPNHALRGLPFGGTLTYLDLLRRAENGEARLTSLTEEFTFDDYLAHHEGVATPLLTLAEGKPPRVVTKDSPPLPGQQVLSLVLTDNKQVPVAA